jgi:hypothetical protein
MRYRLGRILRLVIGLTLLVFMVPFLMSKLDSGNNRSSVGDETVDHSDVQTQSKNRSLEPIMSDTLGNYEPKDLPPQSGPGEGGKMKFVLGR